MPLAPRRAGAAEGSPRKRSGRSAAPRRDSAASTAEGPGAVVTAKPGGDRLATELEAGIGDQRRAGIGYQRHRLALARCAGAARPRLGGVVLVIGRERRLDAVAREQLARDAGVLGQDRIRRRRGSPAPAAYVAEVADRRRDDVKAASSGGPGKTASPMRKLRPGAVRRSPGRLGASCPRGSASPAPWFDRIAKRRSKCHNFRRQPANGGIARRRVAHEEPPWPAQCARLRGRMRFAVRARQQDEATTAAVAGGGLALTLPVQFGGLSRRQTPVAARGEARQPVGPPSAKRWARARSASA